MFSCKISCVYLTRKFYFSKRLFIGTITLPSPLKNALRIRPYVRVITLLKQSDPSLKYEVFGRLNTGGDNLLPQEIRNAMFEGQLNDLLIELSENTFFKNQISGNKSDSEYKKSRFYQEMQDVEYVLRFFTLRLYWNNFKYFNNNMQNAMNQFMDENKNNTNGFSENFNNTMEVVQAIWGPKSFKRIDGTNKIILGIYDAQTVAISLLIDEGLKDKLIANAEYISVKFDSTYRKDTIFQESMRQFTSNSSNIEYRISTMMDLMRECL
ncbi:MAG: hypothetical protein Q7S87_11755 [Agitococcus sp.]|nr:hypothetical protein [Agitococcus sp.]